MQNFYTVTADADKVAIIPITKDQLSSWLQIEPQRTQNIVAVNRFTAKPNSYCLITDAEGKLQQVLLGVEDQTDFMAFGILPSVLNDGVYQIEAVTWSEIELFHAYVGWGLGSYKFTRYKKPETSTNPKLLLPENCNLPELEAIINGTFLVRDLINTPAIDETPADLANIAEGIAKQFGARCQQIIGEDLLKQNFPGIYFVGKGSVNPSRIVEMNWGDVTHPKVTLVGKGVCFDSGGLNIKAAADMLLMKKDMAGAAHALGLAQMLMALKCKINLRVIIPMVENLVSGSSYKPGDIFKTRSGKTLEIANTDAEGRIILAEALTFACEDKPDILIDFSSLTGAARMALGQDVAAMFTDDDKLAAELSAETAKEKEYCWRLPLFKPYREAIVSKIADLSNMPSAAVVGAGAITAALFLQEFVSKGTTWVHFDFTAYNYSVKPGKFVGGEAMCLKGILRYLQKL